MAHGLRDGRECERLLVRIQARVRPPLSAQVTKSLLLATRGQGAKALDASVRGHWFQPWPRVVIVGGGWGREDVALAKFGKTSRYVSN